MAMGLGVLFFLTGFALLMLIPYAPQAFGGPNFDLAIETGPWTVTVEFGAQAAAAEIGATLDLSESRVSQMHSSILARLKAQMADRRKEFQQAVEV